MNVPGLPPKQGLYDPQHEKDSCGVGFVVHLKGKRSHAIVEKGLELLVNLEHRGACGCEANTGDGAGLLIQMPDVFFRSQALGFELPPVGDYGAGLIFLPNDPAERELVKALFGRIVAEEGQRLLGWRHVPTDDRALGDRARAAEPVFEQVFIGRGNAPAPSSKDPYRSSASCTSSASASRVKPTRLRSPIATASTSSASPRRRSPTRA